MTEISPSHHDANKSGILLAIVAVSLFSTSAVLARWAEPLGAYEVTFWRMLIATLTVGIIGLSKSQIPNIRRADLPKFILFGFITAIHFGAYIASLQFTSIAHSLTLVYTAPVFVALLSVLFLKESISARKWGGIVVVVAGVAVLAGFEPEMTPRMWLGDALAIVSAIAFGFYSVAGRSQRAGYSLLTYTFFVYLSAAFWIAPFAVTDFSPVEYGFRQIISILLLGILPLGLGHTLYNAALRRMNATYANLIASQEVTGGILLGVLFLHEIPGASAIIGVIITLVGIILVLV